MKSSDQRCIGSMKYSSEVAKTEQRTVAIQQEESLIVHVSLTKVSSVLDEGSNLLDKG